jgi:LmbE family N-acetylglucosaminyl deacetylase
MWSPQPYYDAIYLSPHLDDVALSCGGRIFDASQSGRSTLIATVTAGDAPVTVSSFAQQQHRQWALAENPVAVRRAEDAAACRLLGVDWLHWGEYDCIYRRDPVTGAPFYVGDDEIFDNVAAGDTDIIAQLVVNISALPACETLFVPLAIGNHVDHQITRAAAEQFCAAQPAVRLAYYEDYPYAARTNGVEPFLREMGFSAEITPLSVPAVQARFDAIRAYASQISTLFGSEDALWRDLTQFVQGTGGERYWYFGRNHPKRLS